MKLRKDKKLITFKYPTDNAFIAPIVPAAKALPDWYKQASILKEGYPPHAPQHIKACMPFFDAMTQGYIVPLWSDIYVSTVFDEETGQPCPAFEWQESPSSPGQVFNHHPTQTEGMPLMEEGRQREGILLNLLTLGLSKPRKATRHYLLAHLMVEILTFK